MLRLRLQRRGVALSAVLAAVTLGEANAASSALQLATVEGAIAFSSGQLVAGQAAGLAQAYLSGALMQKARAVVLGLFVLLGTGGAGVSMVASGEGGYGKAFTLAGRPVAASITAPEPERRPQPVERPSERPLFVPELPLPVAIEEDPPVETPIVQPSKPMGATASVTVGITVNAKKEGSEVIDKSKGANPSSPVQPPR